jgi:Tfp pilus assembly protein PilF
VAGAREAFRAAVRANSDHTQSWLAWAQLEEAQGNIAVARETYAEGSNCLAGRGDVCMCVVICMCMYICVLHIYT